MSLEVTGRLHKKFPTQQIKDNFSKRELILEISEESPQGTVYTNYASFQLVNTACAVLDSFQEGEHVKVSFQIRGNKWERDGQVKYITNLNAWRIERHGNAPHHQPSVTQKPDERGYGTPPPQDIGDPSDLPF